MLMFIVKLGLEASGIDRCAVRLPSDVSISISEALLSSLELRCCLF